MRPPASRLRIPQRDGLTSAGLTTAPWRPSLCPGLGEAPPVCQHAEMTKDQGVAGAAEPDELIVETAFDIDSWEEMTYDEPEEGPKLTRVTIRKTYRGAIEGTGVAEVLTAQGAAGAGYVASERIEGSLAGRAGTFVIQHGGLAEGDDQSTFGTVVPRSGTGALAGLSGRATEARKGVLTLVYTLRST